MGRDESPGNSTVRAPLTVRQGVTTALSRHFIAILPILLAVVALVRAADLHSIILEELRLPSWDAAEHGRDGAVLGDAVRQLDPVTFAGELHGMSLWPPTFPLMELPFLLADGFGFDAPRRLVLTLMVVSFLFAWFAARELAPRSLVVGGAVTAIAMLTSPYYLHFAMHTMLELPGACIGLALLFFAFRHLRTNSPGDWLGVCVCSIVLIFLKYNYGALLVLPVMAFEALRLSRRRFAMAEAARYFFTSGAWRRPFLICLAIHVLLIATIFLGGGGRFSLFGLDVSMKSAGNPTYALIVVLVLRFLWRPGRNIAAIQAFLRRIDRPFRTFALVVILPLFLWFLSPAHVKNAFNFIENRDPGAAPKFSQENLLYYPRAFVQDYAASDSAGIVLLVLATVAIPLAWKGSSAARLLAILLIVGVLAPMAHPLKKYRYFFSAVPLVWLAAGYTSAWLATRLSKSRWLDRGAAILVAVALLVVGWRDPDIDDLRARYHDGTFTGAALPMLDTIARTAAEVNRSVLFGYSADMGPAVVAWNMIRLDLRSKPSQFPSTGLNVRRAPRDRIEEELRRGGHDRVLFVLPDGEDLAFDPCTDLEQVRSTHDIIMGSAAYVQESERRFPETGYRLVVYRRNDGA